jgi:hypothetical protein
LLQLCNIAYQIVFDISVTMTNLDIVSLRSDVHLSKPPYLLRNLIEYDANILVGVSLFFRQQTNDEKRNGADIR